MTKRILKTLTAGMIAAAMGFGPMSGAAMAGGQLSFTFSPTNAKEAQALQTGLALYSLFSGGQRGGSIRQRGTNNQAGLAQNGSGNLGVIEQEGRGHSGTLQQTGNNNAYGLFQFGKNTRANVVQRGNGRTGVTFTAGW